MEEMEYVDIKEEELSSSSSTPNTNVLGISQYASISNIQTHARKRKFQDMLESTMTSSQSSSGDFSSRTDALSVRCSQGPSDAQFKRVDVNVTVAPVFKECLKSNQQFMVDPLKGSSSCINNMMANLHKAIMKKYKLYDDEEKRLEENNTFLGRIKSDSGKKINSQSVVLELSEKANGRTITLNISKIPKYALFPGQCLGVKGSFANVLDAFKDKMFVEEIYDDTHFDLAPEPPTGPLQLIIASGPFTTQENLSFEPLSDLLRYAKENPPNVLMLLGPFYERNHLGVKNGELKQTFDSFFSHLIDTIMKTLENTDIHVIIVSSQKDPHHFPVYPTLPYETAENYKNLTMMPDPAMVNVNGLIIGATTADVLFHISKYEICLDKTNSGPPDRMGRIASHLFKQKSFYPLSPPEKGMHIDMTLMEKHGVMRVKPHLLVLPSNLRHFIKEIDNCLVVNPERLTKGSGGGTFARIEVECGLTNTICCRSASQVLKI